MTSRPRRDALNIWQHIARNNDPAADRFIDLLIRHFQLLGDVPYAGRARDEIRPGYRSFPVGEYLIFYRIMEPGVRILRILHGRMDFKHYPFD